MNFTWNWQILGEVQMNEEFEILTVMFHVNIIIHFNPVTCKWMHEKIYS
jgi:hypothetical protein